MPSELTSLAHQLFTNTLVILLQMFTPLSIIVAKITPLWTFFESTRFHRCRDTSKQANRSKHIKVLALRLLIMLY
jgi:hypothetical protein